MLSKIVFLLLLAMIPFSDASFISQSVSEILSPSDLLTSAVESDGSSTDTENHHKYGNQDMDRMSVLLNLLEKQIVLLTSKNDNQEKDIRLMKEKMDKFIKIEEKKTRAKRASIRNKQESVQIIPKRLIRSTNRESFWSKLQISSRELGSMPYEDFGISIYDHSENTFKANNEKQYFYAPISKLLHKSAEISFNNVTKQHEVIFPIQMWNEELEEKLRKYTEKLVKHPVDKEKIRVLPIEKVRLSSKHQSGAFRLKDDWIDYRRNQVLLFKLTCQRFDPCNRLSHEMKSNPQQFNDLRLEFAVPSQAKMSQEITLRMGSIIDGSFVLELIKRYPGAEEVFLIVEDEKRLLAESKEKIILTSVEDLADVNPKLEEDVDALLNHMLIESRGKITYFHDSNLWETLYWMEEDYRPDKVAASLNELYKKLDELSMNALSNCFKDDSKADCNLNEALIEKISKTNNYSKKQIGKILKESQGNVIWNGHAFIPTPKEVAKVNLEKLRGNKNSFPDKKTTISFTRAMLSTGVHIQLNYKEEENNLISQLKNKVQDLQVMFDSTIKVELDNVKRKGPSSKIPPSSCQDLSKMGHRLDGLYLVKNKAIKKMQTVYCKFDSSVSQELIGNLNVKTKSVHFYVQRNTNFVSGGVIPFELARLNEGDAFNLTSGIFTAPVKGIYNFQFSGLKDRSAINLDIYLRVNDRYVGAAYTSHSPEHHAVSLSASLRLETGDNVYLYKYAGVLYDSSNHYTHFSGWLVEEDLM